eukprot:scaffold2249_cov272-Pinguiococcus_pyrenoidosus.AAC.15
MVGDYVRASPLTPTAAVQRAPVRTASLQPNQLLSATSRFGLRPASPRSRASRNIPFPGQLT